MYPKHKPIPINAAKAFGTTLSVRRKNKGKVLTEVARDINVNIGQLSRFENGDFKRLSNNLQKYSYYLQISDVEMNVVFDSFASRIAAIAARSPAHRAAVEDILIALEQLG